MPFSFAPLIGFFTGPPVKTSFHRIPIKNPARCARLCVPGRVRTVDPLIKRRSPNVFGCFQLLEVAVETLTVIGFYRIIP